MLSIVRFFRVPLDDEDLVDRLSLPLLLEEEIEFESEASDGIWDGGFPW